jgi:hypothetical protein
MLFTLFVGVLSTALFAFAVWLFVFEPRGKIHDL